jgi:pantothenate kinase
MFLCDIGPAYIKCSLVLNKSDEFNNTINEVLQHNKNLQFFSPSLVMNYNSMCLYFFKINLLKVDSFQKSDDYNIIEEFISKKLNEKVCFYCGHINENLVNLIKNLFQLKCVKCGHVNQFSINGLDYISNNIPNAFFDLPGQHISNIVKVGHLEEVTHKNYYDHKTNLYPFILANIIEGTSVYKVDSINEFYRIGGTTFGSTTYWNLVKLTCGYDDPEIAVKDAIKGNNELIDLSVGDIYGGTYQQFSLVSSLIASSFGKLKYINDISQVNKADISRSLITLMCVSLAQITAFLAKDSGVDKVIIVGNPFECLEFMQMVQMGVNYYSEEKIKVYFSEWSPYINLIGMLKHKEISYNITNVEYKDLQSIQTSQDNYFDK